MNLCTFAFVCLCGVVLPMTGFAAEPAAAAADSAAFSIAGTTAQGLGFLAAALSTGLSALGAGIAVAAAAPAAIGAVSENTKSFGKAIIFVVLGEGIAIYGLLISILIINRL
ncbi:ATP synthase subunit C [Oscillibacter sp. MSJ-2]|uniref:ATP synthase subunit C n=2 Tax=Dysosmobacter acutus TaxID=2841504 RepID=A0ABS6F707_9FIRM|nr:ATP synthase subunit C [Dysosmobacter acutus]